MKINKFNFLLGKKIIKADNLKTKTDLYDDEGVSLKLNDNSKLVFSHYQDCCEQVYLEDIVGDVNNILNSPITMFEEVIMEDQENPQHVILKRNDSYTSTWYKIGTVKGVITLRFMGESNGYYSESVDITYEYEGEDINIEENTSKLIEYPIGSGNKIPYIETINT